MSDQDNNVNIVEALRKKTEKDDIEQYLKSTIGGYTKSSVNDYLNLLSKQQHSAAETFSRNQQALFEEKECLKKENTALKIRLGQVESEYNNLTEAVRGHDVGESGFSAADIVALKKKNAALEEELERYKTTSSRLENQIRLQSAEIGECSLRLEQSAQEKNSLKEMIRAEMQEAQKQRSLVSQLSGKLEEKDDEIKFLTSQVSEGEVANLKWKISDLTQQIKGQGDAISNYRDEIELHLKMIETLTQEKDALKHSTNHLSDVVGQLNLQNEKLIASGSLLAEQLGNEFKRLSVFIKEKSDVTVEKLAAMRKLDEANAKIVMLELQLKGRISAEERDSIRADLNKSEEISSQDFDLKAPKDR